MNKEYLKRLIDEVADPDAENKIFWEDNYAKRLAILSENLDETIEYLDTCSEKELYWISEVFDALSAHFKSQKLIDCVEKNKTRFNNKKIEDAFNLELEYMKEYLKK